MTDLLRINRPRYVLGCDVISPMLGRNSNNQSRPPWYEKAKKKKKGDKHERLVVGSNTGNVQVTNWEIKAISRAR